jgi:hypothetical protein
LRCPTRSLDVCASANLEGDRVDEDGRWFSAGKIPGRWTVRLGFAVGRAVLEDEKIPLLVFDPVKEVIIRWVP